MKKQDTPLISILSPVFNEEAHLEEMVRSVQQQDHANWELLIVDDGSEDDTLKIAKQLSHSDSRVKIVWQNGKIGKAKAFNLAFGASRGDAIVLLAGDDRIPKESLKTRIQSLPSIHTPTAALFKLRSFSENHKYHGMEIPKGSGTSASGGVLIMSRPLAEMLFPIPEQLPSEDIWLGYSAPRIAQKVGRNPTVVLEYRIHSGNSNPRQLNFSDMNSRITPRHDAWRLLSESGLPFKPEDRDSLRALTYAEEQRRAGSPGKILLTRDLPLSTRLSLASMSSEVLYNLRSRFYSLFSGWSSQ